MPKVNIELFKILILNFAYVHSNSANLFNSYKVNSHHFANFLHFQSNFQAKENLKIYFCGKIHFVLGLSARDIANHSYAPKKPLTQVLNLLSEKFVLQASYMIN